LDPAAALALLARAQREHRRGHLPRGGVVEVKGLGRQHPGVRVGDLAAGQRRPGGGQPVGHVPGQIDIGPGRATTARERHLDVLAGEVVPVGGGGPGHRHHRFHPLRLHPAGGTLPGHQVLGPLDVVEPVDLDLGQQVHGDRSGRQHPHHRQLRAGVVARSGRVGHPDHRGHGDGERYSLEHVF
jgi:hypothetical protein